MRTLHTISVNDEEFSAYTGDVLLDAALLSGVDIPHDCRAGQCGTCKVRVIDGSVFGGECGERGIVKACQSRIVTDVRLEVEEVPEIVTAAGEVADLKLLAADVVEVTIELSKSITYLPGQYFRVQFKGFPARCFSPTVPLDEDDDGTVRLHVRRIPNGKVSSALGREIRPGHRLKLEGPFGSAYLRPGIEDRLVLVGSGTGFAPLWSIAEAALHENPDRHLVFVIGARTFNALYMVPALCWLAECPNVTVIPVTGTPQAETTVVQTGHPADFIPKLTPYDVVYTAGSPALVDAVATAAEAAGALCYADAFLAGTEENGSWFAEARSWLSGIVGSLWPFKERSFAARHVS